ncbi:carbohydrate-binding protein [Methylomonas lenta]|uniref:Carbohydrate-binding protein n=1 Tax=Methylomonas lenta TaxID=980561 RepID=A0A177NDA6_9GAMM|nr:carbohydrate-binding protein [Methylomonas lenta]OAI15030.1 carbohydrate-binding protein [Methylomonas lenta]
MRKRLINQDITETASIDTDWLNLELLAEVEISSEDASYPIESALLPGLTCGWRAAEAGKQTIRLRFNNPQQIRLIKLKFEENQTERTQIYDLRWSADNGVTFHEIVRQQWNFSPTGATSEIEEHQVDLPAINLLELNIIPDITGAPVIASLTQLRLA